MKPYGHKRRYFKVGRIRRTDTGHYHVTLDLTRETMLNIVNIACVQDVSVEEVVARSTRLAFACWVVPTLPIEKPALFTRAEKIVQHAKRAESSKSDVTSLSKLVVDALENITRQRNP